MKAKCAGIWMLYLSATGLAYAQSDSYSGAYLCLQEFGGGIWWSDAEKKWSSTTFNPTGRVILKLALVSSRMVKNSAGEDVQVTDYQITLTAMGDSYAVPCSPRSGGFSDPVTVGNSGWIDCSAYVTDYSFNLSNLRYLEAYMVGYTSGADNNENTPAIMGGTCAKIQ